MLVISVWSHNQQLCWFVSFVTDSIQALRHWRFLFHNNSTISRKRIARKRLAKCQKQPWQQPCNLIVSHEETFRRFVSPSHEQTASLRWPRLFSWKNKVSKAQSSLGQKHIQHFFPYVWSYITVVPKHYKEIYFLKAPPMRQSQACRISPVKE